MRSKRIMAPVDLSEHSLAQLRWAVYFARSFDAELLALHVVPYEVIDASLKRGDDWEGMREALVSRLDALVTEVAGEAVGKNVAHVPYVTVGEVVDEILDTVRREKCDMVVIQTHGRTGLPHALLGSVAEKVVRLCPVLVLTLSQSGMGKAA